MLNLYLDDINIIIGNININILETKDLNIHNYLNLLAQKGFIPYVNKPTRVTEHTESIIDHIFVNCTIQKENKNVDIKPNIIQTVITDHYMVALSIQFNEVTNSSSQYNSNKQKTLNHKILHDLLSKVDWEEVIQCNDAEQAYTTFIDELKYIRYCNKNNTS